MRRLHIFFLYSLLMLILSIGFITYGLIRLNNPSVIIEWSTSSELDTAGYNLYRKAEQKGDLEKVNPELIPASDDPLLGGDYIFVDDNVQIDITYQYELEEVEFDGGSSRFGPITATPKQQGMVELAAGAFFLLLMFIGLTIGYKSRSNHD